MSAVEARPGIWGRLEEEVRSHAPQDHDEPAPGLWDTLNQQLDPAEFRPKLADAVEIKEFKLRWGNDYAVIANPRELVHYRLEPSEVELVRMMDGTRTVKESLLERFRGSGDLELSGLADLVRQLEVGNFLDHPYVDVDAMVKRAMSPISERRQKVRQATKSLQVDWKGADRMVKWFYRNGLKVFFRKPTLLLSTSVVVGGFVAFVALVRSHRFGLSGQSLALGFLLLLGLDYFITFVHELGHALVLAHYNRRVKSAGIMIYFGSPAFFVESSDGLMLERGQRILQAFAGPYAEAIVSGTASIVALAYPHLTIAPTLYKFAVLNYLVLFFNLVPLLELDGYFILSDLIQVPDLRPRSLSFVQHDLWHKLRQRTRITKQETGLALYAILGIVFTILSLYWAYFFWKEIFGGLISRLWNGGLVTRFLLVALLLFVAGPLIRGGINLMRTMTKRVRVLMRAIRFKLETKWRVEAAQLIDALPMFEDVPEDVLSELAGRVRLRSFSRGQPIVRQGERADAFYVVRTGTLQVVEEDPEGGNDKPLRILSRGEGFGEVGLAEASLRTATVRGIEDGEVFVIDKGTFDQLLADMVHVPKFAPSIQEMVELRELKAFSHLEPDELSEVLRRGQWVNFPPGQTVIEQGETADSFYAIRSGQLDVFEDGEFKRTMGPGSYFGEIALLLDVPRTATVVTRTPVRAYRLEREGFDRLVADSFKRGSLNPYISPDRVWKH